MFAVRSFQTPEQQTKESATYVFRIIKYFLLVSVTANFTIYETTGKEVALVDTGYIVVGSVVLGLYLLGKLQNRVMLNQFAQHPMFARLVPKVDPKVERFLLIGSVLYFIACLTYPEMVNNGVINWFRDAIISLSEAFFIGWIFKIIAFFFLISTFFRALNVLTRILNGQSLTDTPPSTGGGFTFNGGGMPFGPPEDDYQDSQDDVGFTDYEDVTDEEDPS